MQIYQNVYLNGGWREPLIEMAGASLILLFGDRQLASKDDIRAELMNYFPDAPCIGCTTSGEIMDTEIHDESLCLTVLKFTSSHVQVVSSAIEEQGVDEVARSLAEALPSQGLNSVLVLSDGHSVNGTLLIQGLSQVLPSDVQISGGLAGDGTRFRETIVWHNDDGMAGRILLCGFYGDDIDVGHGCVGGWDPFGPSRMITGSSGNILNSLDGKPALELYKQYLGKYADELPSSALLFPLLIKREGEEDTIIRTILDIDEESNSMIFAGDVPEGASAQLMRANFDRLIDGAGVAAESAFPALKEQGKQGLAILISCVGRRLVLKSRTEEELEAVKEFAGENWSMTGFYSYGEISPLVSGKPCALHNQTMTITTISEKNA